MLTQSVSPKPLARTTLVRTFHFIGIGNKVVKPFTMFTLQKLFLLLDIRRKEKLSI
jgi:hypothetical protein